MQGGGTLSTLSPASNHVLAGTMVGEYRVEQKLGEGGMGCVYAAVHPVIAKRAAIKILHAEYSVKADMVDRFIQEARSVNQIGHPNIVDIFSFGVLPDGRRYLVMEYLAGESLRERLRRSRIPIAEVFDIVDTMANALAAAHATGIVHRDLKPDNIFLVEAMRGAARVKLLDFGIAKLLGDTTSGHTSTGNVLGTPAYMSPEQARGHGVDHRTDVYALGAMLYEMLTGSLPFPANNAADMLSSHLNTPPPSPRTKNTVIPRELDRIVTAMMAKDPAQRPPLAAVSALIATLRGSSVMDTIAASEEANGITIEQPIAVGTPNPYPAAVPLPTAGEGHARGWVYVVAVVGIVAIVGIIVAIVALKSDKPTQRATVTPPIAVDAAPIAPAVDAAIVVVPADAAPVAATAVDAAVAPAKPKPIKPKPKPGSNAPQDDDAPWR